MATLPHDYKFKIVNKDADNALDAFGLSKGDQIDMREDIKRHMVKLLALHSNSERIVAMQMMPHYQLAFFAARLFAEKLLAEGISKLQEYKDLMDIVSKLKGMSSISKDTESSANATTDDSEDCDSCEFQAICANLKGN